jgi:hypothetical protein
MLLAAAQRQVPQRHRAERPRRVRARLHIESP